MLDLNKLKKFLKKKYRDSYLETSVRNGIAYQIQALRKKSGLSQYEFALRAGKPQSTMSRLESDSYGRVTITSLLDIAKANDVGLLVRFVDYPTALGFARRMSETDLQPDTIYETVDVLMRPKPSIGSSLNNREIFVYKNGNDATNNLPKLGLDRIMQFSTLNENRADPSYAHQ